MTQTVFLIDTGYACAGVVVEDGTVIEAAPIFKWMIGKRWDNVKTWKKILKIEETKNAT